MPRAEPGREESTDTDRDTADYLFANPLPEKVPTDWLEELDRAVSVEDPGFVLPWNEESD